MNRTLNYVTRVMKGYKPLQYGTEGVLNCYLEQKAILNQTDFKLTDVQTEFLAHGLNFVTNPLPSTTAVKKKKYAKSSMRSYTKQIDSRMLWSNSIPGTKGHMPHDLNSISLELEQNSTKALQWTSAPEVRENMDRFYQTILNTGESVAGNGNAIPYTHPELLKAEESLDEQNEFYITESDKGGVIVLWKRSDYEKEALRQFSDKENYQLLGDESSSSTPLIIQNTIRNICMERNEHIQYLERNNHITRRESLAMQVMDENQKLPLVYLKPKINKPFHPSTGTFQARAVVSTIRGPLYALDKYLTKVTSPMMRVLPGLLKNSDQLIEEIANKSSAAQKTERGFLCPDGHSSEHIRFATADVVAMYPSIDIEEGLTAAGQVYDYFYPMLCHQFRRQQLLPPVDPNSFKEMMKFLFENSFISYQDRRFYRQKKGTPMGGCISAFFANAFMYKRTEKTIQHPPSWMIINQRFIDDFFFTYCSHTSHGTNLIPNFLTDISTDNVKCVQAVCDGDEAAAAVATSNNNDCANVISCNFLDVNISFDPVTTTFHSKPYMKHFAVPSFLHRTSNNPKKVFENLALAQFSRLKRLSSSIESYKEACKKITSQLLVRGFSKLKCFQAQKRVDDRKMLSALSTSNVPLKRPQAKKRSYNTFNVNAKYDSRVNWNEAQNCVNKIHNYVDKHYAYSKNKSTVFRQHQSRIVFSNAGPKVSSNFNRKFKYGL